MRHFALEWAATAALLLLASVWLGETHAREPADNTAAGVAKLAKEVRALHAAGKLQEALPLARRLARAAPAVSGANSLATAGQLYPAALVFRDADDYAQAEPLFLRILSIREVKLGKDHVDVAAPLGSLGWVYYRSGQYAKAEARFQRSLQIYEAKRGKELDIAHSLNALAIVYQRLGQPAKAEPLALRALAIREAKLDKDHVDVAAILNTLGWIYQTLGQPSMAEPLLQRSVAIREAKLGTDHLDVAVSLNTLGVVYQAMGQFTRAEQQLLRALAIREAKLGKNHLDVAITLSSLAALYQVMNELARAEPLIQRALAIRESRLGKDHADVAVTLNIMGGLYQRMGQYARAETLILRSLAIRGASLGKDHLDVASTVTNLGWLYYNMGQYAKALPLFRRSLEIREARLGKDDPAVAESLSNLAYAYAWLKEPERAEPLVQRSLAICEARLGKEHPSVAPILNQLAYLYRQRGDYTKAEPLGLRSLAIREAAYGKDNPELVFSLNNLIWLYRFKGEPAKAEPLAVRGLAIREAKLGKDHPRVAQSLDCLAMLYEAGDRTAEAADLTERSRRLTRRHAAVVLPALTPQEQDDFLRNEDEHAYHRALSLGLWHAADAGLAARSAAWLFNGKAVIQQTSAESILLARDSRDPAIAELAGRLADTRRRLARFTLTTPEPGKEADYQSQIRDLTAQEQKLAKQLQKAGSLAADTDPWLDHRRVLQALPADAALIDIARFDLFDFKATKVKPKRETGRYAAWISRPGQPVRVLDLGPAAEIDAAVTRARAALAAASKTIRQKGEPEAETAVREPLDALAKRVLHPLLRHLDKTQRWIISPDGNLWLVPWSALALPSGKYAIEEHPISFVVSGRDLVKVTARANVEPTAPLVLADPDFDLGLAEVARATRKLIPESRGLEQTLGLSDVLKLGNVIRLPGTASEAEQVRPRLEKYAGAKVRLRTSALATAGLAQAALRPKVLVLSTHGFFLPNQGIAAQEQDRGSGDEARGPALKVENPLLRCGLLFAGCNHANEARSAVETGVLTGLQIVGCDLRGTELVVLSACETGLGDVHNGEGVAGLRQAFQLAGAESVVATLWQIPDRQSAQLMTDFFDNLAAGQPKSDALRNAQLTMIQARRERNAAAHPFFWAAFTLTGR